MSAVEHVERKGGIARRRDLLTFVDRTELDRLLASGDLRRLGRSTVGLPGGDEAVQVAARLGGVVGLTGAALHHGWAVRQVPTVPTVVLGKGRKLPSPCPAVEVHRARLRPDQVDGMWTSQETTLEHCLRRLPFADALAVADSARREGVGQTVFDRLAEGARGPGATQLRRVARECSPLADNPFESAARSIALDVPGLRVRPQVRLDGLGFRADLVDEALRIVIECDSFEWHGKRSALASDARRYNAMVSQGWWVLRLCWEDVMFAPDTVAEVIGATVDLARMMTKAVSLLPRAA